MRIRILLVALLVFCIVDSGLACGKKRKKGRGPPGQPAAEKPAGEGGSVLRRKYGPEAEAEPYSPGGDSPGKCEDLKCDGEGSCNWSNNQPPADQLNWATVSGDSAGPVLLKTFFNTEEKPSGKALVTASDIAGSSEQTAQLYSAPITCSNGDITVKLKHWQTAGTKVEVCSEKDPAGPPENCQPLSGDSGKEDSVTIPKGENVRIVIQAKGFTTLDGDIAIVDDIDVQCEPCADTTAPPETTAAKGEEATTAPAEEPPCKEIVCTFDGGSTCQYKPASGGGQASDNFGVHEAIYQNRLTGVRKQSNQGGKFAAGYTKKKGEKTTLETEVPETKKPYVVRYEYYEATQGVALKGCCNDESGCQKFSDEQVQTAQYNTWSTDSFECPAGTKKVFFVCENLRGESEGACGVDNIQLLESTGGQPGEASKDLCAGKGGGSKKAKKARS